MFGFPALPLNSCTHFLLLFQCNDSDFHCFFLVSVSACYVCLIALSLRLMTFWLFLYNSSHKFDVFCENRFTVHTLEIEPGHPRSGSASKGRSLRYCFHCYTTGIEGIVYNSPLLLFLSSPLLPSHLPPLYFHTPPTRANNNRKKMSRLSKPPTQASSIYKHPPPSLLRIIELNRVSNTVTAGKVATWRALVVAGDGNGKSLSLSLLLFPFHPLPSHRNPQHNSSGGATHWTEEIKMTNNKNTGNAGYAIGKASLVQSAVRKAKQQAVQHFRKFSLYDNRTIWHDTKAKVGRTVVELRTAASGKISRAQPIMARSQVMVLIHTSRTRHTDQQPYTWIMQSDRNQRHRWQSQREYESDKCSRSFIQSVSTTSTARRHRCCKRQTGDWCTESLFRNTRVYYILDRAIRTS